MTEVAKMVAQVAGQLVAGGMAVHTALRQAQQIVEGAIEQNPQRVQDVTLP